MSSSDKATTSSIDHENTYTKAIQLLCLLKHLGRGGSTYTPTSSDYNPLPNISNTTPALSSGPTQSHKNNDYQHQEGKEEDEEDEEDEGDEEDGDDSVSINSLDVVLDETSEINPQSSKIHDREATTKPPQKLLKALSFIAAVGTTFQSVTAVAMEAVDEGRSVCFRVAMNGDVPSTVMESLDKLGQLLMKRTLEGRTGLPTTALDTLAATAQVHNDLFDLVVQMKEPRLTVDLYGKYPVKEGLLAVLTKTVDAIRGADNKLIFPIFNPSLRLPSQEVCEYGPYSQENHHLHMEKSYTKLQGLLLVLQDACLMKRRKKSQPQINFSKVKEAILLAHELRTSKALAYLLSQGRDNTTSRAMAAIRKLSRYWQCTLDLMQCARSLPVLEHLTFAAVPNYEARQLGPGTCTNVVVVLHSLLTSLGFSLADVQSYCRQQGLREAEVWKNIGRDLERMLYVHAEVKLVYFYMNHPYLNPETVIECNKHACFACYCFVQQHSHFKMAKTHTKIYSGWGLPQAKYWTETGTVQTLEERMLPGFLQTLTNALGKILNTEPTIKPLPFPPDSSSGVTTTESVTSETTVQAPPNRQEDEATVTTGFELAEQMQALGVDDDTGPWESEDYPGTEQMLSSIDEAESQIGRAQGECSACLEETSRKCSRCDHGFFCSMECERFAEPIHIFKCAPGRPIDSADHLVAHCVRDEMPDDELVQGFGLDRCKGRKDRVMLLGLYQGMVSGVNRKLGAIRSQEFRRWQQENSLAEHIYWYYGDIPRECVGAYFPWFEKNKHIVDANAPKASFLETAFNMDALRAWMPKLASVVEPDDLFAAMADYEEYSVVILYGTLKLDRGSLLAYNLPPWRQFGFCTCPLRGTENALAELYLQLFEKCTSAEFHDAFKTRQLEHLAIKKGLKDEMIALRRKGIYLHPKPYSVYGLKQFIAMNDPGQDPEVSVRRDYGFLNCKNFQERRTWRETYKKVLESENHNDLKLHEACMKGKIFDYVRNILPETPESFRGLCQNPYP